MELTFAPKNILQIDDARITFKNFEGRGDKFNREGDRNFALIIPTREMADELLKRGWNVKIKPPRDDQDDPFMYLSVKVKFNDYGPNVYLVTGKNRTSLREETVGILDDIDISRIDLDIRPYDWSLRDGKHGRAAYLQNMQVVQNIDRFAAKFAEEEAPEEEPFV